MKQNMKAIISCAIALLASCSLALAQEKKETAKEAEYQFTTIKENPITSIKNQYRSGTCWCFSALSFIESELLRTQNKTYDLSEMWVVGHAYSDRAKKYVRLDGKMGFSAGSGFGDVFTTISRYGIVPESVYSGYNYGSEKPEQAELDAVLKAYVDAVLKAQSGRGNVLTTAWHKGLNAVIQAYMGDWTKEFKEGNKTVTPETYRDEVLKFNADDYVNICSFSDQPWYKECEIEVCDNWRGSKGYNVPSEDMMKILYNAIDKGYTALWGGDVSEKGFTRDGLGVILKPKKDEKKTGSDQEHWVGKDKDSDKKEVELTLPEEIDSVSDSLRLSAYDRKMTTDDHGMHIYGYAQDQNGTKYFMVKNSWGDSGKYKGIWYMSDTFIRYKTLNFVVNKEALPKDIRKKLGL